MRKEDQIRKTIEEGLSYLAFMEYTDKNGIGLCERWIINHRKKSPLIRPDCTAEYLNLLMTLEKNSCGRKRTYEEKCKNLARWCVHSVTDRGSPFGFNTESGRWESDFWINDNAKVLIALTNYLQYCNDTGLLKEIESAIQRIFRFLALAQEKKGSFKARFTQKGKWFPPFVTTTIWGTLAYLYLYRYTKDEKIYHKIMNGIEWLLDHILDTGRLTTTYELYRGEKFRENWRPPSSESAELMILLSEAYREFKSGDILDRLESVFFWLSSLQTESGGVVNCDIGSKNASEQNNTHLADMVYTNGYALIGGLCAYESTGSSAYRVFSEKLGTFLSSIQVHEDVQWRGGWRGSYDVVKNEWAGRALYGGNTEEEGGMYSVYTGWTTVPILQGLAYLLKQYS